MPPIIVFGSINMDLVAHSPRLPVPGETLLGNNFSTSRGGKGANQAIAAAKLGAAVKMVGRVGGDRFGKELLDNLQANGVDIAGVAIDQEVSSGVALIVVGDDGENQIVVVPGANGRVDSEDIARLIDLLPGSAILLLQLEIPLPMAIAAAKAAKQAGVTVILDPAPVPPNLPSELYQLADIITPNEVEASQLAGFAINDPKDAIQAATLFRQRGTPIATIKLGERGALCATAEDSFFIPAFPQTVTDAVGAGDAFNGAMAAGLATGLSLREAVLWGTAAGAIAITQNGAQAAMPNRQTLLAFLQERIRS